MATYLFAWNPNDWEWTDLETDIRKVQDGTAKRDQWSIGRYTKPGPGDRFFMIKLGKDPRGLMGSGHITSDYFEDVHYNDPSKTCNYVSIAFDFLVDGRESVVISREELGKKPFKDQHWDTQSSGISIKPDVAASLESIWVTRLRIKAGSLWGDEFDSAEEFIEGAPAKMEVNRYERDPDARKVCIDYYGARCSACDIDFADQYGSAAAGFIHVHHLLPLSTLKKSYVVDPIKDLRPVCPNCHSVIHRGRPPYSIEKIREFIAAAKATHR